MSSFGHTDHDRQRRHLETEHTDPVPGFAADRLRVLECAALGRLSGITQVDEPDAGPTPHNRLTHSLQVAAIGVRLAHAVGADPSVVETGCLAHDLGHPPFGHNGERALHAAAERYGVEFEANAQTLRILTRLEPGPRRSVDGLNLTRASLDAACKYPWLPGQGRKKFGAYPDDADLLTWIRDRAPGDRPCPEAQIMDFADDIANTVTDLTRGVAAGAFTLAPLADPADRDQFAALAHGHFTTMESADISCHTQNLLTMPELAALTSTDVGVKPPSTVGPALTRRFLTAAVHATRRASQPGPCSRYSAELVVPDATRAEIAVLKALHLHFVLRAPELRARRARQRDLLDTVFDALIGQAPEALEPRFAAAWAGAGSDRGRVRVACDQIAACTDRRVTELATHHRPGALTGDRLPVPSPGSPRRPAS